jgi:small subunit ribosomal protein S6
MFIVQPGDRETESRERVLEEIKAEIARQNGTIEKIIPMGKREFTYSIKRFRDGYYFLIYFRVAPQALQKMTERFKINTSILRELILAVDEIPTNVRIVEQTESARVSSDDEAPVASKRKSAPVVDEDDDDEADVDSDESDEYEDDEE